jgi:hypothetical protein
VRAQRLDRMNDGVFSYVMNAMVSEYWMQV